MTVMTRVSPGQALNTACTTKQPSIHVGLLGPCTSVRSGTAGPSTSTLFFCRPTDASTTYLGQGLDLPKTGICQRLCITQSAMLQEHIYGTSADLGSLLRLLTFPFCSASVISRSVINLAHIVKSAGGIGQICDLLYICTVPAFHAANCMISVGHGSEQ